MKILFTSSARSQFLSAIRYIQKDNMESAKVFKQKAETSLVKLIDFPKSGRVIPEFPELPFREIIISPYRFFYRIQKQNIWIVAVWHDAQLPKFPGIS